jgi:hypothetical protein
VIAAYRHIGSWTLAIEAAGLQFEPAVPRWDAEKVIERIRRRIAEGRSLSSVAVMREEGKGLVSAAQKYVGRWLEAVRQAGGTPHSKTRWSDDEICAQLRALARAHPRAPMTMAWVRAHGPRGLARAATRNLGWSNALGIAGLGPMPEDKPPPHYRRWTRDEVLRQLRASHAAGLPLTSDAVTARHGSGLRFAASRYFGSWRAACRAAIPSYRPPVWRRWDTERLLAEIRRRSRRGLSLSATRVARADGRLIAAAHRLGLTWREACRRARVRRPARRVARRRIAWNKSLVLSEISGLAAEGRSLLVAKQPSSLALAAWRLFGGWLVAVRAVGLLDEWRVQKLDRARRV